VSCERRLSGRMRWNRPTHLDSHQYRLYANGKELFEALLRVAHEKKLPFLWRAIGLRSIRTWNPA